MPPYIPTSAHDGPPNFSKISKAASDANLKRLRKYTQLDVDYSQVPPVTSTLSAVHVAPTNNTSATNVKNITSTIAQQEREFQKAVQPGSPISALLSSARQPLLMTNPGGNGITRESPLLKKLQVKESPLGRRSVTRAPDGTIEEREVAGGRRRPVASQDEGEYEEEELRLRKKELEAQKARIVAQMAPVKEEVEEEGEETEQPPAVPFNLKANGRERYSGANRENVVPSTILPLKHNSLKGKDRLQIRAEPLQQIPSRRGLVDKENIKTDGLYSIT